MPIISRFYGLIVKMYFRKSEHNPPHIHIIYGEYSGMIEIETAELIEGDLPKRALSMAKEWTEQNKEKLMKIWNTQEFEVLPPLL